MWITLGLAIIGAGLLPQAALERVLVALSYDGQVEHLGTLVVLARGMLAAMGLMVSCLGLRTVRRFLLDRVLPLPARPRTYDLFPQPTDALYGVGVTAICWLPAAIVWVALVHAPHAVYYLLKEDGLFENLQAIAYLTACGLFTWALGRAARRRRPVGAVHVFLALFAMATLFVGLEEISYGQRLFGFATPEAIRGLNSQNEFNLHNLGTGMTNRAFAGMAFLGGFLVPLAARFSSRLSFLLRRTRIELPRGLVIPAFAVATVFANPPGNHRAVLDEQQVISVLAILGLLGLLLEAYRRQAPPRETWALLFVTATVVVMKAIHLWLGSYWPRGNYVEEVKEFYLAIGFLGYAVVLVRVYGRPVPLFSARIIPRREPRRGQRRVRAFRAP